jgi:hypothetical protein
LAPVLARLGVALAYQRSETSSRLVKVKVEASRWEAASRFWLEPATPAPEEPRDPKSGYLLKHVVRV